MHIANAKVVLFIKKEWATRSLTKACKNVSVKKRLKELRKNGITIIEQAYKHYYIFTIHLISKFTSNVINSVVSRHIRYFIYTFGTNALIYLFVITHLRIFVRHLFNHTLHFYALGMDPVPGVPVLVTCVKKTPYFFPATVNDREEHIGMECALRQFNFTRCVRTSGPILFLFGFLSSRQSWA